MHTIHEGHKDYKCESCGKSFSRAGHLNSHVKRIHDGQKNQICNICGIVFVETSELNKHIKKFHGQD